MSAHAIACFPSDGGEPKRHHFFGRGDEARETCHRCGERRGRRERNRSADYTRKRRAQRIAEGRCYYCGASPLATVQKCAACHQRSMEKQRQMRVEAKRAKCCPTCGRRCDAGHTHCEECRAARRAAHFAMVERGLCPGCRRMNDRPGKRFCVACAARRSVTNKRAYHEGRVMVRRAPRGKEQPMPVAPVARTPLSAKVYLPPAGSIALGLFGWAPRMREGQ